MPRSRGGRETSRGSAGPGRAANAIERSRESALWWLDHIVEIGSERNDPLTRGKARRPELPAGNPRRAARIATRVTEELSPRSRIDSNGGAFRSLPQYRRPRPSERKVKIDLLIAAGARDGERRTTQHLKRAIDTGESQTDDHAQDAGARGSWLEVGRADYAYNSDFSVRHRRARGQMRTRSPKYSHLLSR